MNPLLTVVIINWNAQEYILDCIRSVLNSDYPNLEVIFIDNNSTDESIYKVCQELTEKEKARVNIRCNLFNHGCAYAENQGLEKAKGKYMSVICGDTKVDKSYFSEIVKTFEDDPTIGAVGAKMLVMKSPYKIDSVGEYLTQYGILIQRHTGQEIDWGQFQKEKEMFAIKGAGLTLRTDVLRNIGGFPDDYFMFLEETDVCWRVWLYGFRIVYCPKAVIYHATSTSIDRHPKKNYLVKYLGTRNYIYTCLKNYSTKNLFKIMPIQLSMWFAIVLYMLIYRRFGDAWNVLKGICWNLVNIDYVLRNRKKAQKIRRVKDKHLKRVIKKVTLKHLIFKALYW